LVFIKNGVKEMCEYNLYFNLLTLLFSLLSAVATMIIAYTSFKQIKFIINANQPCLELIKLSDNIYRLKNIGIGVASDIKIIYNNIEEKINLLYSNKEIEIEIDISLDWDIKLISKSSSILKINYKDIYSKLYSISYDISMLNFTNTYTNENISMKLKFDSKKL